MNPGRTGALRTARLIAAKDLRIERRSRIVTNQVLPFAGVTMLIFAFALDANQSILETVAPGLVWLATMFSLLVLVQRAFAEAAAGERARRLEALGRAGAEVVELSTSGDWLAAIVRHVQRRRIQAVRGDGLRRAAGAGR